MKYYLMFVVPTIFMTLFVLIGELDPFLILWTSLASLISTLDSFVYEKLMMKKIGENMTIGGNDPIVEQPAVESSHIRNISGVIYGISLIVFAGVYMLIESNNRYISLKESQKIQESPRIGSTIPEEGNKGDTGSLIVEDESMISYTGGEQAEEEIKLAMTSTGSDLEDIKIEQPIKEVSRDTEEIVPAITPERIPSRIESVTLSYPEADIMDEGTPLLSDEPFGETSLAGEAGLKDLISRGYIRLATSSDHDAWLDAVLENPNSYITKKTGHPLPEADKQTIRKAFKKDSIMGKEYYVALKNFTLPSGMFWKYNFYIPKGIRQPRGDISNGEIYDYNTLTCSMCRLDIEGLDTRGTTSKLVTPDKDMNYFAGGGYSGKKTDKQIDTSGHYATIFEVYVNSPDKPATLILGAYEPSIWVLRFSKGTKIAKVILGGYHGQEIIGIPPDTDIEKHTYEDKNKDYFYISEGSTLVSSLKKYGEIQEIIYTKNDGKLILGDPLTGSEEWFTDTSKNMEEFYNTEDELAGEEGLEVLVEKGYLRKATNEDKEAWINTLINSPDTYITKKYGYPVSAEDAEKIKNDFLWGKNGNSEYVALKNFTLPGGMYWKFGFYIPKGIKIPEGDISNGTIYDYNTLTCMHAPCRLGY